LRPIATRLKALLADPGLVPKAERGILLYALGWALTAVGEQTDDNAALEAATAVFRDARNSGVAELDAIREVVLERSSKVSILSRK
jgi:hypothetical protein